VGEGGKGLFLCNVGLHRMDGKQQRGLKMGRKWTIIDNDKHQVHEFRTRREWREKQRKMKGLGYTVKRSSTDDRCVYTTSVGYVPLEQ